MSDVLIRALLHHLYITEAIKGGQWATSQTEEDY